MLERLKPTDSVEITLRDKTVVHDVVVSMDRDGTTRFKELGYRYRSGMEYHDYPSKKDIVDIKVIGAENVTEDETVTDDELGKLKAENAELKEKIEALQLELDAARADKPVGKAEPEAEKPAPKTKKDKAEKGKNDENKTAE